MRNHYGLSSRQTEILQMLSEAMGRKLMAGVLKISPKTIEHHIALMEKKLNVFGDKALVKYAIEHGLSGFEPRQKLQAPYQVVKSTGQLLDVLLAKCEEAANGKADPVQANTLCQYAGTFIDLARLQMEITDRAPKGNGLVGP